MTIVLAQRRYGQVPRWRACLALALFAQGCFDMEKVELGPAPAATGCETLLINDFEDGSGIPHLEGWERWQVASFTTGQEDRLDSNVGSALVHDSKVELVLDFDFHDVKDGKADDVGAVVAAHGPQTLDLTRYQRLVFSAALVPGLHAPPIGAQLAVELGCKSTPSDRPAKANERRVMQGADLSVEYRRFPLELANFGQPSWETNHIKGGTPACLRGIESIGFSFYPTLEDGQEGQGKLVIDDILLDNGVDNGCAP